MFESTFIETEGGDQQIAAAIADLYSPNFKYNLRNWLETVEEYPRPFNMRFVPLTDFFTRLSDTFIDEECKAQCFSEVNIVGGLVEVTGRDKILSVNRVEMRGSP